MGIAKFIGKKLPFVVGVIAISDAAKEFSRGDIRGAALSLASGAISFVPVVGVGASIGIDIGRELFKPKIIAELKNYSSNVSSWAQYLGKQWGLEPIFAWKAAQLYLYCYLSSLSPVITSGFRSPEKQKAMLAAWNKGQRTGLRYKPAVKSDHSKMSILGTPAATAMDMDCNNPYKAKTIANYIGLKTGYDYGDDVHFNS